MKDAFLTYFSFIFGLMLISGFAGYLSREPQASPQAEFNLSSLQLEKYGEREVQYPQYIDALPPAAELK